MRSKAHACRTAVSLSRFLMRLSGRTPAAFVRGMALLHYERRALRLQTNVSAYVCKCVCYSLSTWPVPPAPWGVGQAHGLPLKASQDHLNERSKIQVPGAL
eukprot:1452700-Prymnesium_polylepis.1